MELSVVIPAYNEADRIGSTLKSVSDFLSKKKWEYEIIVIDDGSKDGTVNTVNGLGDSHIKVVSLGGNRGKGFAVWKGLSKARYSHILFSDADLSAPIEDLDRFMPFIDSFDVIIGSRNLPESKITKPQPWLRSHLGKTFPLLVRALALPGIKDSQCGFKLFNERAKQAIVESQTIFDFGFDVEILFICKKRGYTIKEVGVHWGNAEGSKVRPFRDSAKMLIDLFKIRMNNIKGRYTTRTSKQLAQVNS